MITPLATPTPIGAEPQAVDAHVAQLRWIASAFDSAQRLRVRTGEQLRAVLQGRDVKWLVSAPPPIDTDALLASIRNGETLGPVPLLGMSYQRYWRDEREMLRLLGDHVSSHPAWPWLDRVKGIGASLAARLLSRLDVERAPTPSSFWAYCGLATVAAELYRCATCGYTITIPAGRRARSGHRSLLDGTSCEGQMVAQGGAAGETRVAQPRPARGQSAPYDQEAKKLCYLVGVSFLRQGGKYKVYYRDQRSRLDAEKGEWIARRRHLTALRMTEKLFLAHLWLVWRERLGLPVTRPYAQARLGGEPINPWQMVDR